MTDKTAFKPGDASKINIPSCLLGEAVRNRNKGINIGQATRSFQVDIPARVGYSVKNMATFGPGKAGGGGIAAFFWSFRFVGPAGILLLGSSPTIHRHEYTVVLSVNVSRVCM